MMPEDCPSCVCGAHAWESGGGSFGGSVSSQWFTCPSCGRKALDLCAGSNQAFVQMASASEYSKLDNHLGYINEILLVAFRANGEKCQKARDAMSLAHKNKWFAEHDLPLDSDVTTFSKELRGEYSDSFYEMDKQPEYRCPIGFECSVLPPQIPKELVIRLGNFTGRGAERWTLADNATSQLLPLPIDPIRVRHDAYFLPLFEKLGLGHPTEITNQYCGAKCEPWYQFIIGECTFVVGPRKRVDNIEVFCPSGKQLDTTAIAAVAKADDTTYYADEGWKSDAPKATKVCVHAWNKEKLEQYLTILMDEARKI